MDTSGEGIMQKKGARALKNSNGNVSNEELQTILKFGARNMFKQEDEAGAEPNKLEQLNLDDVLSRAEFQEGVEQSGTALGSAEFLEQFSIADVAVNQLSWDELIPENLRAKATTAGGVDDIPEEFLLGVARRIGAPVKYTGADMTFDKGPKKKKKPVSKKTAVDPSAPLAEKEVRHLIRSLLRFGEIDARFDVICQDANLSHKSKEIILSTVSEIMAAAADTVANATKSKEEKPTKMFTFGTVTNINAPQLIQRVSDMKLFVARMSKQKLSAFRVTWPTKPITNWGSSWGPKEDAMLLIGIYKHGFGNWELIQHDEVLGLKSKIFLEAETKTLPKSHHLLRRGEYLLKLLAENETKKVKSGIAAASRDSALSTPVSAKEKPDVKRSEAKKPVRERPSVSASKPAPRKSKQRESKESVELDEATQRKCKDDLRPVKKELKALMSPPDIGNNVEKAKLIKTNLATVGQFILDHCSAIASPQLRATTEGHLFQFASVFWPTEISSASYRALCKRVLATASGLDESNPPTSATPAATTQQAPINSQSSRSYDSHDTHMRNDHQRDRDEHRDSRTYKRQRSRSRSPRDRRSRSPRRYDSRDDHYRRSSNSFHKSDR